MHKFLKNIGASSKF